MKKSTLTVLLTMLLAISITMTAVASNIHYANDKDWIKIRDFVNTYSRGVTWEPENEIYRIYEEKECKTLMIQFKLEDENAPIRSAMGSDDRVYLNLLDLLNKGIIDKIVPTVPEPEQPYDDYDYASDKNWIPFVDFSSTYGRGIEWDPLNSILYIYEDRTCKVLMISFPIGDENAPIRSGVGKDYRTYLNLLDLLKEGIIDKIITVPKPTTSHGNTGNSRGSAIPDAAGASRGDTSSGVAAEVQTVSSDGTLRTSVIKSQLENALKKSGNEVTLQVDNANSISVASAKAMLRMAADSGKKVMLQTNTLGADRKTIQGVLSFDLAGVTHMPSVTQIKLGVFTEKAKTNEYKKAVETAINSKAAVIVCEQEGPFGTRVQISAKVSLADIDANNLQFYVYDSETGSFTLNDNPEYTMDSNGVLRFYTESGGILVITAKTIDHQ